MAEQISIIDAPFIQNNNGKLIKVNLETVARQVKMNDVDGVASDVQKEIEALRTKTDTMFEAGNAMVFKGILGGADNVLPATDYKTGWTWRVNEVPFDIGSGDKKQVCEIGDLVVCINDYAPGTASADDFVVAQANIDNAVKSIETASTDGALVAFSGTDGRTIKAASDISLDDISDVLNKKVSIILDTMPADNSPPEDLFNGGFLLIGVEVKP